jgi:hypothetical protein
VHHLARMLVQLLIALSGDGINPAAAIFGADKGSTVARVDGPQCKHYHAEEKAGPQLACLMRGRVPRTCSKDSHGAHQLKYVHKSILPTLQYRTVY